MPWVWLKLSSVIRSALAALSMARNPAASGAALGAARADADRRLTMIGTNETFMVMTRSSR